MVPNEELHIQREEIKPLYKGQNACSQSVLFIDIEVSVYINIALTVIFGE